MPESLIYPNGIDAETGQPLLAIWTFVSRVCAELARPDQPNQEG